MHSLEVLEFVENKKRLTSMMISQINFEKRDRPAAPRYLKAFFNTVDSAKYEEWLMQQAAKCRKKMIDMNL